MLWIVIFLVLLALVPWMLEAGRGAMTEARRAEAPGDFVQLPQGITHYRWIGPVRGPVVVAIHGLSTPSPVWEALASRLGALGFRVLVYDLFGRGYSDTVSGPQDRAFFVTQLRDLLAFLELEEDLTLMGYSMGGAIATAFASEHPGRLRRLVLIAPSGIVLEESRLDRIIRTVPVVGDWLHGLVAAARLRRQDWSDSRIEGMEAVQAAELDRKGYLPALLSSRRHMLAERQEEDHRRIGHDDLPVIAIWGRNDAIIPVRGVGTLAQWNRNAAQEVVDGAGHGLVHTHPDEVTDLLRDVLAETRAGR